MHRRQILPLLAGLAAAPVSLRAAFAWPDQSIRLIVPFTPAGGPDMIARYVAEQLSPRLGQPIVVENMPGASGNIGSQVMARAKPDGNTLMSSVNTLVMNASLFSNLPYDPVADFTPISLTAWGTLVLVAHPGQAPATLGALIAAAKASPKTLNYGSPASARRIISPWRWLKRPPASNCSTCPTRAPPAPCRTS
jgi:tripartite-type tricarboxylate transporter receptor subunit TctC